MQASEQEIFDWDVFDELCRERGWDRPSERANALGVHIGTVMRLEAGERRPGLTFANRCRRVFGLENFVRLFPLPNPEEASDVDA
ncbi:hypothetical protein [Glycomyces halotolerans]